MRDTACDERDACGIGFVADEKGRARRAIVDSVLAGLERVKHRGALSADEKSSDGAGVLMPVAPECFARLAPTAQGAAWERDPLGVAMVFLPDARPASLAGRRILETCCEIEGLRPRGWREVPVEERAIGEQGRSSLPRIAQLFLSASQDVDSDELERCCYRARRRAETATCARGIPVYVCSLSFRTICYKALCSAERISQFYPDLGLPDWEVSFGIFHQRFSTNTSPSWERVQPYRMLCHNGEINTIEGNERRMRARSLRGIEGAIGNPEVIRPVVDPQCSDSGKLDAALEFLVRAGRELSHAMTMMIPEAWEADAGMPEAVRDFYHYQAFLMEPWGGPAALIATDGRRVAASLDRNGFRPLRWWRCEDGLVAACSEAGAVDVSGHGGVRRGRLGPGQMLCVDPERGGFRWDPEIKCALAAEGDYGDRIRGHLQHWGVGNAIEKVGTDTVFRQLAFGWSEEDVSMVLEPMATTGREPRFSMGDDVPLPVLGRAGRSVHHALRQRFAQVTNPPIDSLREKIAMSLRSWIGQAGPLLRSQEGYARLIELPSFFVFPSVVERLLDGRDVPFPVAQLDATYPVYEAPDSLEVACRQLALEAEEQVRRGAAVLVIRDLAISRTRAPLPILLALGAIQQRLVRMGVRADVSLVCDTDEPRDTHHFAALLGYGADLVCPRLALEVVARIAQEERLGPGVSSERAQAQLRTAVEDGVRKIMSKMGISTVQSYRGAQLFEVLGLADEVVDLCLTGTRNAIGGLDWERLGAELRERHERVWARRARLPNYGLIRPRKGGEYHANNPQVIGALHEALGLDTGLGRKARRSESESADPGAVRELPEGESATAVEPGWSSYRRFADLVNRRPPTEPQDLLEPLYVEQPVPLDEVEPVESICRRFGTGAMSHGALGREVHESIAIAMNRIGGRSNCGEGGEARERFFTRGAARDRNSRVKQIASGRFGVTAEYCVYADELQIKMSQGSKPGEGGQIPGDKVTEDIARQRHTRPGVGLISPPPHHDIYSIEDLAQLIFDLKQVNARADVSVKLVSTCGVGTIAAGVAKGLADSIVISGSTGGSGASPLSSIKHAGLPWAVGLAETQRALIENGLRSRVRLSVDGGLKTGRDVIVAALLGADEYDFGTAALMAQGCSMVRSCHLDTCPEGIATQKPRLRSRFRGTPEMLVSYLRMVAEEVRHHLAALGCRALDEVIGRRDLLFQRVTGDARIDSVDLRPLLSAPVDGARRFEKRKSIQNPRSQLGDRIACEVLPALRAAGSRSFSYRIDNRDRAVGAALGGAMATEFGIDPPPGRATVELRGAAGQSFGAFLSSGVTFDLTGEANDGVGKGMGGGCIAIRAPQDDLGEPHLAGNAILYGATGGEVFIAGAVGERFAVRNSGALGVAERAGRHACEYMTGGRVLILGPIGSNLGAGMTGGEIFVYDTAGSLARKLNHEFVYIAPPEASALESCRRILARHLELTGSARAAALIDDWEQESQKIFRIAPRSA